MKDPARTNQKLIEENALLKQRIRELEKAESERMRMEQAYKDSEIKYRSLIEHSTDVVFCVDQNGEYKFVNQVFASTFGQTPDYFLGKTFWDIYPKEHADHRQAASSKVFATGESQSVEVVVPLQDRTLYFIAKTNPLRDETGKVVLNLTHATDITERKQAEEALRKSEARYHQLLDAMTEAMYVLDAKWNYLLVNKQAAQFVRMQADEMINRNLFDLFPDIKNTAFFDAMQHSMEERVRKQVVDKFIIDQRETWYELKIWPVPDGLLCISADITERKQIEEKLIASEKSVRQIAENIKEVFWISAPDWSKIYYISPAYYDVWGEEAEKLYEQPFLWIDSIIEEDREKTRSCIPETIRKDIKEIIFPDYRIKKSDGAIRWISARAFPIFDSEGNPHRVVGVAEDITVRKQAEEKLQEVTRRLRLATASTKAGVWDWHLQTNEMIWDDRMFELYGLSHENFPGGVEAWEHGLHPDDSSRAIAECEAALRGEGDFDTEFRVLRPDGQVIHVKANGLVLRDEAGKPLRMIGLNTDITERKRDDEVLRMLAIRNDAILASVPDIIMEVDSCKRYTWANQAGLRFFGRDVVGQEASNYFDGEQAIYNIVQPLFSGDEDVIYLESWQRRQDGVKRLLSWWCKALKNEQGCVTGALSTARDITDQKLAEEALRDSQENLKAIFDTVGTGIFIIDSDTQIIIDANQTAVEMTGIAREKMIGQICHSLVCPAEVGRCPVKDLGQIVDHSERKLVCADRHHKDILKTVHNVTMNGKKCYLENFVDITELKRAEEEKGKLQDQLLQSQKMESVGRLAGGVAHDFNNMLAVILGHTETALEYVDPDQPSHANLTEILKAAGRSADLTRQLLAFARKQTVAPRVLDLNKTISGMLNMLQRLIGEDIDLNWQPEADLWQIEMDPSQIDQILVNLCVNARDAISGVGKLTIETANSAFDEDYCTTHAGFILGEYVRLAVSDNGCGMDKETLSHLFEPFFTTKETGKGTGLGLATVYGIIKQNNGFINVYSEAGQGTTFAIYLPRHAGKAEQLREKGPTEATGHGQETILLAEDEPALLELTTMLLKRQGYTVLAASTPGEAIRLAREHAGEIHLLMTDVIMPEMNGRELAKNLLDIYPHMKRLFTSGYTANVIAHHGVLDKEVHFIQKPFSRKDLATKIREALDQK